MGGTKKMANSCQEHSCGQHHHHGQHSHGHEGARAETIGVKSASCPPPATTTTPPHQHSGSCGHIAIEHGDHIGFVVDGQMQCFDRGEHDLQDLCFEEHVGHAALDPNSGVLHAHLLSSCRSGVDEPEIVTLERVDYRCTLPISDMLPAKCNHQKSSQCASDHVHGPHCGHETVQHGDHVDFLVKNDDGALELHHVHTLTDGSQHCDIHGQIPPTEQHPRNSAEEPIQRASWRFRVDPGLKPSVFRVALPIADDCCTITIPDSEQTEAVDTVLFVEGICCPSEVPLIEDILSGMPGVAAVKVNVPARTTYVNHVPALTKAQALADALNGASLGAYVQREPVDTATPIPPWNVIASGILWMLSLLHYAEASWEGFSSFKYIAIGSILLGLPPIAIKALGSARRCVLDINSLMTLAVIGAIGIGDYAEGAAVVFLFAISEYLETRSSEKARNAIASVMALKPEMAELLTGRKLHVDEVRIGSVIQVRPGEKIPIDGMVTQGASSIDEASLTGESRPVPKGIGDEVLAGTQNLSGYIQVTTTALAKDSAAARLVKLVADAQTQRSPTEATVASFAKVYTPIMVLCALVMATVPWFVTDDANAKKWFYQALVLLVVACPCALVISTPITYVCALACSAKRGILIKGGMHLETLGRITALALDKTGTLTKGSFQLTELQILGETSTRQSLMYNLASVEAMTSHPMAVALVAAAKLEGLTLSAATSDYTTHPGEGVSATVDGQLVEVGNAKLGHRRGWFERIGSREVALGESWEKAGGTVGYVALNGEPIGMFSVSDAPREEARKAMARLKEIGIRTVMLTGDNQGSAEAIQKKVEVEEIHAGLHPEDKTRWVGEFKETYGKGDKSYCFMGTGGIGMVGDGINDAPALAAADVGLAMGAAGTAVAMETADCVLMDSNLMKITKAIELGRLCGAKIRENILLSILTKLIMIGLIFAGYGSLWLAIITDVGTMLLVTFNGMSVIGFGKEEKVTHGHGESHIDHHGGSCCSGHNAATTELTAAHGHGHGHGESHNHHHEESCCSGHNATAGNGHGHGHAESHSNGHGDQDSCCSAHHTTELTAGHGHGHGHSHGCCTNEDLDTIGAVGTPTSPCCSSTKRFQARGHGSGFSFGAGTSFGPSITCQPSSSGTSPCSTKCMTLH